MLNKKIKKLFVLATACLMLTSCGDIIAKPSGYDEDKILENIDLGETTMNNMMNTIYDAMHETSTLSATTINILNEKLFNLYFGTYAEIETAYSTSNFSTLIDSHKAYQEFDDDGNRKTDEDSKQLEVNRVKRTFERIQKLIAETLYTSLESTDYQDKDGLFSEKLFALGVYKKLYKLDPNGTYVKWNEFVEHYDFYDPVLLVPYTDLYDVENNKWVDNGGTQESGIIHISSVTNKAGESSNSTFGYYREYVENEILPTIYQNMLSQYYLYSNEYSSLGSKYARKVTYISIAPNSNDIYSTKHSDLVDYFARTNILTQDADSSSLYTLENCWIGYNLSTEEKTILENAGFEAVTIDVSLDDTNGLPALTDENTLNEFKDKYKDLLNEDGTKLTYYAGTLFGDIIEQFKDIKPNDIKNSSKTAENKFSGNNTYSYYEGFIKEVNALLQKELVVDEWGLKSDGFAGLDSTIKDRLMSITVATDLVPPQSGSTYKSNYLQYTATSGKFYLLPEKRMPGDDISFVLSSGTTKYIVQVDEAASVAKLSKRSSSKDKYSPQKAEDVAYEICNLLADNSTTKTNAMEYFLEDSELLYHDDNILKYFKENYPNLFED